MNLAFLTMVWRDYWLLQKWVDHNAALVPRRSLYVVNHGGDPEIDRIAEGCNVIHVPRDGVTLDLTRRRWDLVGGITNGLLAFHDLVVCTDVDELLVYVGGQGSLLDHLARREITTNALAPVGLNLIPRETDSADMDLTVLQRHPNAMLSARYTKPCIAARPVTYTIGGHGLIRGGFEIDPEILLFHLHYITPDYAERMSARKDIVSESKARVAADSGAPAETGRFWINWSRPDKIRQKEFGVFDRAQPVDVEDGFGTCAEILSAAKKSNKRKTVIDSRGMEKSPSRVVVPDPLRGLL